MTSQSTPELSGLLDDRPADGLFRVHRSAYTDPRLFELEMARVFEGTWVFIGLASQAPRPFDYFTAQLGRQPVLVTRDEGGRLHAFFNSCRHRGALLATQRAGTQKVHVCRYHGWAFDAGGRCVHLPARDEGQYPEAFDRESDHGLVPLPRFAEYRGLLFASACADVPSLEQHLGEARWFLDLVLDQAPEGFELVPGSITYTFEANWKFQMENGLDYYHFASTHASYMDVLRRRVAHQPPEAGERWVPDETLDQGTFSFERGHAVMWGNRNSLRVIRPFLQDPARAEQVRAKVGERAFKWMQMNRNLTIFPNLQLIDVHSLQLRLWNPLAVDRTEMRSWCLAPIGESRESRRARIRQYEDFFNPSGMATADDNRMFELSHGGQRALGAGWTEGHLRGLGQPVVPPKVDPWQLATTLEIDAVDAKAGDMAFGGETCLHSGYREWLRLLQRP
ncbi:Rieske 2Fe-2S domain-containing protein [Ramlibacter sp. AW1]|uniref:Rieske 2Fe-2S domain-containing protein n=1 Tax=Ramlibacter aurantiacus TaxID=2801330 RepID=A0A936ZSN4_9BURK|nr:SRPBCC family protein [Ramlibacter aurantiacus]MBL0422971.1 Rieske 2Fe-2S domain-containing protein [Ramlibacter aurantiacus]